MYLQHRLLEGWPGLGCTAGADEVWGPCISCQLTQQRACPSMPDRAGSQRLAQVQAVDARMQLLHKRGQLGPGWAKVRQTLTICDLVLLRRKLNKS